MLVSVPSKSNKIVTTKTTIVRPQTARNTTVVVTKQRRRRRRPNRMRLTKGISGGPMMTSYYRCLTDPFNCPPVRLGYGTMVPTQLHTAYLRTSTVTSAAGNLNLFVLPNPNNFVLQTFANGQGVSPEVITSRISTSANVALLNSMYDLTRTVAMGLRIYPMVPATSVPGIVSLGCAPRSDLADFVANYDSDPPGTHLANASSEYVFQMPYMREHMAKPSNLDYYQLTWRPTDIRDFEFTQGDAATIRPNAVATNAPFVSVQLPANGVTSNDTQGSFLVAAIQGLPANTTVYFEAVLHLETIDATNPLSSTEFSSSKPGTDSVADENPNIPTIESVYRSFRDMLPSVDTVAGAATSLLTSPIVQQAARNIYRSARSDYRIGVRSSGYELL